MVEQAPHFSQLEAALEASHRSVSQLSEKLELANETMERLSYYDTLTGLPNRSHFHEQLNHFIALARREHRALPVLLLDFNRFREINDKLGHDVGDRVLREVARRVCNTLRDSDIAARLGADEFAVMLPTTDTLTGAQTVAQKVIDAVERPFDVDGRRLLMGVSVGISMFPEHGSDDRSVLRQADRAMGEAKRSGGGYVACERAAPPSEPAKRVVLAGDVRDAIENKELVLFYQPKIALATGRIIGGEALVRWQHPTDGLIFPDEFIHVVENTSVINLLTEEVLDSALAWVRGWHNAGRPISVAVNLSPRSLHDPNLPMRIDTLLAAHNVPPAALVLEITEGAIMIDAEKAMLVVTALAERGVGISIDDFGTGYSSLAYLRRLPVAEIKIDRSFVMTIDSTPEDVAIVRSVVDLGRSLGKRVVAEGIETEESMTLLAGMGCDAGQGYFISRPVPEDAFRIWLEGREPA